MAFPLGIFFGGLAMLIVAVLEAFRRNALGTAAFGTFSSFWIAIGGCGVGRPAGLAAAPQAALAHCQRGLKCPALLARWRRARPVPPPTHPTLPSGVYGIVRASGVFFLDSPKGQEAVTALFGVAAVGVAGRRAAPDSRGWRMSPDPSSPKDAPPANHPSSDRHGPRNPHLHESGPPAGH